MFEEREHKSFVKHLIFYVLVASLTIIVMSVYTISFRANLDEAERCGYTACATVVNNNDPTKAAELSCRCQCESTQIFTSECAQAHECVRNDTCWRLSKGRV